MRFRHRTLDHVQVPTLQRAVAAAVTPDFRLALGAGSLAVAALIVTGAMGSVHGPTLRQRVLAGGGAAAFLVFSVLAIRNVGNELHRVLSPRTGPSHANVVRWVVSICGYAIVLLTALGLLDVPVQHLLLGGALTGVIVGIAAQQALGNVFAGVVLLLARPFNVGDTIWLRAGALGGDLQGEVTGMGLTYVTMQVREGPVSLPNSAVLGAAIGPQREPRPSYPSEPEDSLEPATGRR